MRVDSLESDVFLFRGDRYDSGALAVFAGERALLIDGMASIEDARRLREKLVDELSKRVVFLISTHYFSDHLAAWNLFPEASVIAHANALQTFWTEDFRTAEEAAHFRAPSILLSGRLELEWGRFRIDVFENPGHTADALGVDLPEADLLHVGDAAVGRIVYLRYSAPEAIEDRKSTRLNSSHRCISYAVFCLKK